MKHSANLIVLLCIIGHTVANAEETKKVPTIAPIQNIAAPVVPPDAQNVSTALNPQLRSLQPRDTTLAVDTPIKTVDTAKRSIFDIWNSIYAQPAGGVQSQQPQAMNSASKKHNTPKKHKKNTKKHSKKKSHSSTKKVSQAERSPS